MDSLFQKMLAESNTEIETNVDIVFVIDVTKSMERMIDIIQTAAISFLDEFFEKMNSMKRRVENLRVKVHIPQELRIRSRGTERHSASN